MYQHACMLKVSVLNSSSCVSFLSSFFSFSFDFFICTYSSQHVCTMSPHFMQSSYISIFMFHACSSPLSGHPSSFKLDNYDEPAEWGTFDTTYDLCPASPESALGAPQAGRAAGAASTGHHGHRGHDGHAGGSSATTMGCRGSDGVHGIPWSC